MNPRTTNSTACFLIATLATTAPAADWTSGLADALTRDSELTLHWRSHYLNRVRLGPVENLAWAGGGWLGYRSGWIADRLRLGLTGYSSQRLYGPLDKDGTSLLATGQQPYNVLGEAFGALKLGDQTFTAGRFLVNQFEVNPQDTRMTPRTFEGAALTGTLGGTEYFAGYIDSMKHRNWDEFVQVATVAGAPATVTEPMLLLTARGTPTEALTWGAATYYLPDLLSSTYADVAWTTPLGPDTRGRLGAQFLRQTSVGDDRLTGSAFSTWTLGVKADLIQGPFTLSGILMETDRGAAYRTPFGSWRGYTSRIINNFNRAGERVWGLDAAIDFAPFGAPGLSMNTSLSVGDDAINATTGAALSRNSEYDVTFDYRFTDPDWPSWARPLWLRARAARLGQTLGDRTDVTTEYHLILNYTHTFK
ncbi:OprD family outer membrane porin [Thiocystis violacea]|uniref:OprD family outer membrane porin n=1 Tax=Thiocystis violacea TaxID=13725 RepID=UPI0019051B5C|nr:OprD family outer membrane porin [Thiocystis violacea]MBK1718725.1 hypothetical protein [Thiocystis violacea]